MKRIICLFLIGIMTLNLLGCQRTVEATGLAGKVKVTFLQVGKADAILIQTENSTVMIDTGTADGAEELVKSLKSLGIEKIDWLILSHFDQDHVGGAAVVLTNFTVSKVLTTFQSKESDEIEAYEKALKITGLTAIEVRELLTLTLDGVEYTVIPPEEEDYGNDTSNDSSLVVKMVYGETSFLFAGDVEEARIDELLSSGLDLSATVLKVPHHGRYEDNTKAFIKAVSPEVAVITSSDDDLEDEKTVHQLEKQNVTVYLTREGTVTMISDGTDITVDQ